jgi:hypothetical protein
MLAVKWNDSGDRKPSYIRQQAGDGTKSFRYADPSIVHIAPTAAIPTLVIFFSKRLQPIAEALTLINADHAANKPLEGPYLLGNGSACR